MEKLLYYIISGVLLYLVKKIFDATINPKYPKEAEFNLFRKRHEIYKKLYYSFCFDFSKEQAISKYSFDTENIENQIFHFYKDYSKNEELTELLSYSSQSSFRKYIANPNAENFGIF